VPGLSFSYLPVPLRLEPESKAPKWIGWQRAVPTEETVRRDFTRLSNLGVRTGDLHRDGTRLLAIDVDLENGELIRCVEQALGIKVPCKQGKKGFTYFIRVNYEQKSTKILWQRDGAKIGAIDVLCIGAQTVVPPSIHPDTKLPYRWVSGTPLEEIDIHSIPVFGPSLLDEIRGFCKNPDDPIFALNDMEWAGVGGGGNTHDMCVAAVASMVARKWTDADIHDRIERAKSGVCEATGLPYNWPESQKIIQGWIDSARDKKFGEKKASRQKSQGSYVDEFVRQYGHLFRYDLDTDSWYRFDGVRWRPKQQLAVKFQITNMLPEECRNSGFVGGIEQLLRCWPQLQVHRTQWNPSTHLLNTPEGTIDLRTGRPRPHNPADMIICVTAVSPIDAAHPLWSEKKLEWFGEADVEQAYIQTLAALCITGETRDAVIPFWVGPGGDGNSANAFLTLAFIVPVVEGKSSHRLTRLLR